MEIDSRRDKFLALLDERNLGVVRCPSLLASLQHAACQSYALRSVHLCGLGMLHGACCGRKGDAVCRSCRRCRCCCCSRKRTRSAMPTAFRGVHASSPRW